MILLLGKPPGVPCPPNNPHCNGNAPDVPLDNPYFIYGMMIISVLFIAYKMGLFAWIKHDVLSFGSSGLKIMPSELKGIYNNRGWVKIESEDDLPKEKELFRFIPCNNFDDEFIGWFDKEIGEVLFIDFKYYKLNKDGRRYFSETNAWLTSQITHYQPIVKPEPPLY